MFEDHHLDYHDPTEPQWIPSEAMHPRPRAAGHVGSFSHWPKPPAEAPQPLCQRCAVRLVVTTATGCRGSEKKKGPPCDVQVEGAGEPRSLAFFEDSSYAFSSTIFLIYLGYCDLCWGELNLTDTQMRGDGMESLGGITAPCIQYVS